MTQRPLRVMPHRDHPRGATARPAPRGWAIQGRAWSSHLQSPPSYEIALVFFFQLCQHPGETGGGPGVKGDIPYAWLRLEVGHPPLCMAWGRQLRPAVCMAMAGSVQVCLAWLEWRCMSPEGRGVVRHLPLLAELTCDSKAQKML